MKRIICFLLALVIISSSCACEDKSPSIDEKPQRQDFAFFDEFLKNFKNEKVANVILDPSEFLTEWGKVSQFRANKETALEYFKLWNEQNSIDLYGDALYNKEVVLFSIAVTVKAEFSILEDDPNTVEGFFGIDIQSLDSVAAFEFALSSYDFLSKAYGLTKLSVEYKEVSAEEFAEYRSTLPIFSFYSTHKTAKIDFYYSEYGEYAILDIN